MVRVSKIGAVSRCVSIMTDMSAVSIRPARARGREASKGSSTRIVDLAADGALSQLFPNGLRGGAIGEVFNRYTVPCYFRLCADIAG